MTKRRWRHPPQPGVLWRREGKEKVHLHRSCLLTLTLARLRAPTHTGAHKHVGTRRAFQMQSACLGDRRP